ncbi:Modification methylase DpnIIB [compost metagenome]
MLKPNGSLYLFCSAQMSTDIELMMRKHLCILNHIVWAKPHGRWNGCRKESLRRYFPATERIIFAEPYGAEGSAQQQSGYRTACHDLRRQVFAPLIEYFRNAREAAGVTAADIHAATGVNMASHWFGYSQWQMPSQAQYEKLQALFADRLGEDYHSLSETYQGLNKTYQGLAASYEQLRVDFDRLRRPFTVTRHVPYTDVWAYPPVQHYPGKHPCEKPAPMMEHIIQASSRPGDLVADFFMGSGATGKAALHLGRQFLGVELDQARFGQTRREFEKL